MSAPPPLDLHPPPPTPPPLYAVIVVNRESMSRVKSLGCRQTQRKPVGAQTVGQQQDRGRYEAAQRLHVPTGDGRPRGRAPCAFQPVPAVGTAQQSYVPADGRHACRRRRCQGREKRRGRVGVRSVQRRHGQADAVQTVTGRRRLPGRAARAQVRGVLLLGRGQQTAGQGG